MGQLNTAAVNALFNHYHAKVQSKPNLYTNSRDKNKAVLVVLPTELLDFANKGAGHSGFGAGARPVGIRRVVDDAKSFLKNIFSSTSALEQFILSSECDAHEYIASVKMRHALKAKQSTSICSVNIDNRPAREVFFTKYGHNEAKALQNKFGRDLVTKEFDVLTINEFELRFGLVL